MADQGDVRSAGQPHATMEGASVASQWSEHNAPDGRKYYYNSVTGESTWERPSEFVPPSTTMNRGPQQPATTGGFPPQQQQLQHPQQGYTGFPQQYGQPMSYPAPYGSPGYMYPYPQPFGYAPQLAGPGPPIQTTESGQGPPGCNLFVFHIPNDMTNQDLFNYFATFGNVISARIMVEKETGRSRGFGFVSYDNPASAEAAIKNMNGFQVGRKRLKVQHKKEKSPGGSNVYGEAPGLAEGSNDEMASPAPASGNSGSA